MIKAKSVALKINYQGVIAVVIAILIGAIFSETSQSYLNTWLKFDESMGHALIIVAIVVFHLLQPNKIQCTNTQNKTHWLLLIPTCLLIIFHQISTFWGILLFQQLSLYFLWLLAVYFILGKGYFKQNLFPLLFFLFAVPFWEFLNPIFLNLTTRAVTYLLDFTPVIAFIDGNRIELPYGMLEIAGGCSGLRYFEIGLALSIFAVYPEKLSKRLKLLVIVVGVILGVVTNWIRVLSLIYVGYESQMTSELITDHETHGLILFMLVITPLIFFINWLSARYSVKKADEPNLKQINNTTTSNKNNFWYFTAFLLCTISITSVFNIENSKRKITLNVTPISVTSHPILNDYGQYDQIITQHNSSCELIVRNYQFIAAGRNALPFSNIYNKQNYSLISSKVVQAPYWSPKVNANQLNIKNIKTEKINKLYYWYQYNNITITNRYIAKLFEIVFLFDEKTRITLNTIICS